MSSARTEDPIHPLTCFLFSPSIKILILFLPSIKILISILPSMKMLNSLHEHKTRTAEVTICIMSERLPDRPRQLPHASFWGCAGGVARGAGRRRKCFRKETNYIANGNPGTRVVHNFAQTRPPCEAEFVLHIASGRGKFLRQLRTQTRKSRSNKFARFNDRRLNWQTRPPRSGSRLLSVFHGRRKHSSSCGNVQLIVFWCRGVRPVPPPPRYTAKL